MTLGVSSTEETLDDVACSLWLMPTSEYFRRFSSIIQTLARQYGTPVFAPHATLCSGTLTDEWVTLEERVDHLCQGLAPVALGGGIGQAEAYSQFLFVVLQEDEQSIFQRALQVIPDSHLPSVGPHLSLMYSDPTPEIDRARISEAIRGQLPERIVFSAVQVVSPSSGY